MAKNKETSGIDKAMKVLDDVKAILQERQAQHGDPRDNLGLTAELWSNRLKAALTSPLTASDAALLMVQFKAARLSTGSVTKDSLQDLIGYAVLALALDEDPE